MIISVPFVSLCDWEWIIPPPMLAIPPPPVTFTVPELKGDPECIPNEVFSSFMLTATTAWLVFPRLDRKDECISLDWAMPVDTFCPPYSLRCCRPLGLDT